MPKLPTIIVTGASGFIGSHLLEAIKDEFYVYALARRSQKEAGIPIHPHIHWIRVDIKDEQSVKRVMTEIKNNTGADYLLHLAGYYDFSYKDNPEYTKTNVEGTFHVLEHAKQLDLKLFMFASSLTVSKFPESGARLNEESPANASFPYASSKIKGEKLVKQYQDYSPGAIIRSAAIFSDWCEYAPLYYFLATWLSRSWKSRIIAGQGKSAIPYLHINDLITFIRKLMKNSQSVPKCGVYIASPDDSASQFDLYTIAGRYFYSKSLRVYNIPKSLAYLGILLLNILGRLVGKQPFEKLWMLKYVDLEMPIDASITRRKLGWSPTPRYHIKRRLLFIIENMKSNPYDWLRKNEAAAKSTVSERPNFKIYTAMVTLKDIIVDKIFNEMTSPERKHLFQTYQDLEQETLKARIETMYRLLETAIRIGDRLHLLSYAQSLAKERFLEGFYSDEVSYAVRCTGLRTVETLLSKPDLKAMEQRVHDQVMMTIQIVEDEIEETFDKLIKNSTST
ncbi:NAD-dependent epimerase/dehydratase family protein [candidate division CSSED10-310 bacterium]|uniref:NAD-dependent epimerase/dehydratase family protein n=1 Tax=candidate division CSSED10-310 bacterium TaxID=2855610 RepID=A0ABV6Z1Z6_UNCC1